MLRDNPKELAIRSLLARKKNGQTAASAGPSKKTRIISFRNPPRIPKRLHKRFVRYGLLAANLAIVVVAVLVVVRNSGGNAANYSAFNTAEESRASNPLDTLTATDIAVNIARMTALPEELSIVNLADDVKLELSTAVVEREFAVKPQILSPDIRTKEDIKQYQVVPGDTVASVAAKFGVTSDTIRWSNGLTGNNLRAGITLTVPPQNGVMYSVLSGDTVEKIARVYRASASQIIAFNDIELTGIKPGDKIFIPNGQRPAPAVATFVYRGGAGKYPFGWCTYYAASRAGVTHNWGNARSWAGSARQTPGWVVGRVPTPGAIAQTTRMHPLGHVAIVEEVSPDGTRMRISDMNGVAGWGQVGYSGWIPVSSYDWFISRG